LGDQNGLGCKIEGLYPYLLLAILDVNMRSHLLLSGHCIPQQSICIPLLHLKVACSPGSIDSEATQEERVWMRVMAGKIEIGLRERESKTEGGMKDCKIDIKFFVECRAML